MYTAFNFLASVFWQLVVFFKKDSSFFCWKNQELMLRSRENILCSFWGEHYELLMVWCLSSIREEMKKWCLFDLRFEYITTARGTLTRYWHFSSTYFSFATFSLVTSAFSELNKARMKLLFARQGPPTCRLKHYPQKGYAQNPGLYNTNKLFISGNFQKRFRKFLEIISSSFQKYFSGNFQKSAVWAKCLV